MKVKGWVAVEFARFRVGDRSRVTFGGPQNAFVGLLFAARWPGGVNSAAFGVGGVAAGPAGVLPRSLVGVRLVAGASRGRVEAQTSGARGLPRDLALRGLL